MVDQGGWSHVPAFACWLVDHSEEVRNLMLSAGVVGAGIGVWIAFRRSQTDRLRQITDSFEGAVMLLGHENRSVRLGAIYALERIARQNRNEYWPIMETLTAFVRERAMAPWPIKDEVEKLRGVKGQPPVDIQAALSVISRRYSKYDPINRKLNFAGTNLATADFEGARLEGANFSGAILDRANFADALLYGAYLSGAYLDQAVLAKADLGATDVSDVSFEQANLEGATFLGRRGHRHSNITQEQLNSAVGDRNTKIPEGLTRPQHWSR